MPPLPEEDELFRGSHVDLGVRAQVLEQRGGSGTRGTDDDEVRTGHRAPSRKASTRRRRAKHTSSVSAHPLRLKTWAKSPRSERAPTGIGSEHPASPSASRRTIARRSFPNSYAPSKRKASPRTPSRSWSSTTHPRTKPGASSARSPPGRR